MSKNIVVNKSYDQLLQEIVKEIELHKIKAARDINATQMQLYYSIGGLIVKKQKKEGWGKSVVEQLERDLPSIIKGAKSYSSRNLWYMRKFYLTYQGEEELRELAIHVPWGQNLLILDKIKGKDRFRYYLHQTYEAGWSRKTLLNMIKAETFENHHIALKKHNFGQTLPQNISIQADEILKSKYVLDFLDIEADILERQLENRIIENIKDFILELGYGFTYIGNQYKLRLKDKEYFLDLLFYHRKLQCLVAIDLKIGEFKPEYAGKMNFYLNMLNDQTRLRHENPSIGIILCAEKDNIEVEYALQGVENPIGVAEYTYKKRLPPSMKNDLPGVRELKDKVRMELKKHKL
ncbi:MAG: DUF1016 domain-containing protein [Bacteroidetes bacterium]|nr:MAG: DUF1016 domain-containing protein [Bacteroidota bacterium]